MAHSYKYINPDNMYNYLNNNIYCKFNNVIANYFLIL